MKKNILIVDKNEPFIQAAVDALRSAGFSACGLIVEEKNSSRMYDGESYLDFAGPTPVLQTLLANADVIFLEHDIPIGGDRWIRFWTAIGVDFSKKRVVGMSEKPQPYLAEHVAWQDLALNPVDIVQRLLD